MPRSGWVASGAVLAALSGAAATSGLVPGLELNLVAAVLVGGGLAAVILIRGFMFRPNQVVATRRTAFLAGALIVGLRLAVAAVPGTGAIGLPTGQGPWLATVFGVSAPKDGNQLA